MTAPSTPHQVSHSVGRSLVLHLAPGLLALAFYLAAAPWFMRAGLPPLFASLVTIPLILVPWMLGYLALEGQRLAGRFDFLAAVPYRRRLSRWQYLAYGVPLIVWGAVVFLAAEAFVSPALVETMRPWLPAWFVEPAAFDALVAMPAPHLVLFLGSLLVLAGVVAPVVEELYFRGHLLPAVERYGVWAPIFTTALFTLYHFESPWENPARFVAVLPLTFIVWRTRSVAFAIVVHVALNTLSALALAIAVFGARAA